MKTFKRIFGIVLLGLAFLFILRIPTNLHSADPKKSTKIGADVVLAFILGGSALVLLNETRKTD